MSASGWAAELKAHGTIAPRRSLAEEAADTLREFILLGKLKPGMPVPERDLAEAMGVSRTPLKEALRILEIEGLIVYSTTRRPRVADPTIEELTHNLVVLGGLEALAGELACIHASDDDIARAAELESWMAHAPENTAPLEFFRWDMDFHGTIVRAANNPPLLESHERFNARLWRARFISSKLRTGRSSTLAQHADIIAAFKRRDATRMAAVMRHHLETAVTNIRTAQDLLKQQPEHGGLT